MDCVNCKSTNAKIKLDYLGKTVCNSCFCKIIERRISKTIRTNKLISKKDKILVALSAGKDSALTLNYLARYAKPRNIKVFAAYVNRGDKDAKQSYKIAKQIARDLGIEFYHLSFKKEFGLDVKDIGKILAKSGGNPCSVCGVLRRNILNKKAKEIKATKLATGHNLTDEAQSYLMNLLRGELKTFTHLGPKSLPKRREFVQRIKILRNIPEREVKLYVKLKKIKHFPKPCACRIGSLRFNTDIIMNDILKFRPSAEFSITKAGDEIAKLIRTQFKNKKINICKACGEPTSQETCRSCQFIKNYQNKKKLIS